MDMLDGSFELSFATGLESLSIPGELIKFSHQVLGNFLVERAILTPGAEWCEDQVCRMLDVYELKLSHDTA
jgi:hypothetical protein